MLWWGALHKPGGVQRRIQTLCPPRDWSLRLPPPCRQRGFALLPLELCGAGRAQQPRAAPLPQPLPPKSHSQAPNKKLQHKERRGDLPLRWEAIQNGRLIKEPVVVICELQR